MTFLKRFAEWFRLKEKLDASSHNVPLAKEREIWWVSLGENVGSEMGGKNQLFSRPALIIKKLTRGFFLVAPTTTKPHEGSWYVKVRLGELDEYVCLNQIRTIDYRRMYSLLGQLDGADFARVKEGFNKLYR